MPEFAHDTAADGLATHDPAAHWPLLREYPQLATVLAPVALAMLPTPVAALPAFGPHAWIKRDDITHPVYGGNKIRKLEFVVAEMRRRQADRVITLGATGTNSGIAASMVCAQEHLPCTILMFPQPDSPTVQANQRWMQHFHAGMEHYHSLWGAVLRYYFHPQRLRRKTYFLFAGCSNPVSTFGYVNAAFELREQIRNGECPEPAEIIVPVSSASTLAGLTLGVALAGLDTRVTGIRVAAERLGPFAACTPGVVTELEDAALKIMRRHVPALPLRSAPVVHMNGSYFGPGYGDSTPAATQAIAAFREHAGLSLESTYSGKAAAAFLDRLATTSRPVLFWNTFNSRPYPQT